MTKSSTNKKPRIGIYSKGQNRVSSIVDAAETLLIEEGYHNFSLRKVAAAAGIKLGNLQYYFPTKDDLVKAMLDQVIQVYLEEFNTLRASVGDDPIEQFKTVLKHVIYDLNSKKTTVFFPEIWSLSNHEDHVTQYMDAMYGQYRETLEEIILLINPKLSKKQAQRLALFVSSSLEGHTIFIGYDKPWISETDSIASIAIQSFLWLIIHGEIPD
ncbi:MAG: TetR/AcrR family transcriptional regulator [Pseudomonadales bacterium]|nr:TetR/AcrR family transcriptional regulator [Pseudomonadales bacterium]